MYVCAAAGGTHQANKQTALDLSNLYDDDM